MRSKPRAAYQHLETAGQDAASAIILIADDDEGIRLMLRRVLERDGYEVIEACDGEEGLALSETHRPSLVIMDAVMPKMDGFAACHALQGTSWGCTVPVLMLTVLDDESSIERAFKAGAYDYLNKPINISVLTHRIRHILINSLAEQQLLRFAYEDELTGLPNRRLFLDRLHKALGRRRPPEALLALMFLDMDKLKSVNDSLGHEAGDTLIKHIAKQLSASLRESDTVARLAGDEFAILLDDVESQQAIAQLANKLLHAVREPVQLGAQRLQVTASIGIALAASDSGDDAGSLLRQADSAMYRCKQKGRDSFLFHGEEETESAIEQLLHGQQLLRAIEANQFTIHYQPVFRLADAELAGAEALIRWHPPDADIVYPDKFIGLIEETDLIIPLGDWMLRTVCGQLAQWQAQGITIGTFAVNLSPRQFADPTLVAKLRDILNENAIEPRCLELDITEHGLVDNSQAILDTLHGLRALGVTIAFDDFGARGWISLAKLDEFPIDTLKIDRSLVYPMLQEKIAFAAVRSACVVGRCYDANVVAKGVETAQQLAQLQSMKCDRGQGYYWSESLSAAAYEQRFYMEQPK